MAGLIVYRCIGPGHLISSSMAAVERMGAVYSGGVSDVQGYLDFVDGLLAAGCAVYPDAANGPVGAAEPSADVPVPSVTGGLGAGAVQAATDYRQADTRIAALQDAIAQAAREAVADGQQGRAAASAIRGAASSQGAALAAAAAEPAGMKALVSAMDERLGSLQVQLRNSRARMQEGAALIRQHSQELPEILGE